MMLSPMRVDADGNIDLGFGRQGVARASTATYCQTGTKIRALTQAE